MWLTINNIFCRTARTIIDAVLGLSLDDTPSNLAAAALFFVLTSDVSYFIRNRSNRKLKHVIVLYI